MVDRWTRVRAQLVSAASAAGGAPDESWAPGPMERGLASFAEALCDDLNVARAIAALNDACGALPAVGSSPCPSRELSSLLAADSVLGVLGRNAQVASPPAGGDAEFVARIDALVAERAAARSAKDWATSDRVRAELAALGVSVKDGPQGATWSRVGP